ncbi:MAG: antA/AntB antirepressor family protein [Cetobacterium sp.]
MDMIFNVSESAIGQVISARELYEFLEVERVFTSWIKGRIEKYGFLENTDFVVIWNDTHNGVVVEYNGNPNSMSKKGYSSDYLLTMDMAKELSMIENNEKGRQARKYFIACEKKYVHMLEAKLNQLEVVTEVPKKEKDWGMATLKRNIRKAETIEKEIEKLIGELKTHYEEIEKVSAMKADSFTGTYQIFRNSESEKRMLKKGE